MLSIGIISIFIHQHIRRTCIYQNTYAEKQTLSKKTYNNARSAQSVN